MKHTASWEYGDWVELDGARLVWRMAQDVARTHKVWAAALRLADAQMLARMDERTGAEVTR